ncbi:RNA-directed DNA polymerase from mobile element jockey [Elysia marginata]|uniref:RNA-directed DNA polymerase from mobile element jockey n=1 Tax=Elysia marginata TaxID=1093978 RepID=A0AAV4IT59_9GAST|nr:RNA-directed DNA polymerase from mobile element jockey [Elysia marginata]
MNYWLESEKLLNSKEAGFRSLKSTEDQVTRITQIIVDGLNDNTGPQRRGKRTVMALIDFSRAFDKVWHMGLLWKMSKMKCSPCLLKTTKALLSNQQSRVRFEGKTSHYKKFTGGVPQGGVLSPTLFLIFINDISSNLPEGVEVSLFADNLALLTQNEELEQASSLLQQGLECIEKWSKKWKMTLNVDKCETGKDKAYVCGLEDFPREKLVPVPDIPPWQVPETFTCCATLGEGISKADAREELKKAVEDTMKKLNKPNVEVFTDGSARDGVFFLGGGILVIEKEERHSLSIAAGRYGSSYRAESMALKKALSWLQEREKEGTINLYNTDSQSLVRRLEKGPTSLENEIWTLIHQICSRNATNLHIQWIPGHCGIAGNDEADHLANQCQIEDQREVEIYLKTAKAVSKRHVLDTIWAPQNVHESQQARIRPAPTRDKEAGLSRRERVWSWPNYAATEKVPSSRSTSMILVHHRATPVCSVAKARTISTTPFMTVLRSTFFGASSRETPWSPFGRAR